ncbi:MAG: homoserine O-acetyltransferase [Flavobacteriales bacterium]
MSQFHTYRHPSPFITEKGETIHGLEIAFHTHGKLNNEKSNAVWVCHALTANSNAVEWWAGLVGEGCVINPEKHFIVCANLIGSCYGSTGPLSVNAQTGKPYYRSFPFLTIRDMVNAHRLLATYLEVEGLHVLAGGSLGGQQCIEWAVMEPDRIKQLFLIATNAKQSAYGIAFNESQRMAIEADPTYFNDTPQGGANGLKVARAFGLISYRSYAAYNASQAEDNNEVVDNFKASSYQRYQGEKLVARFNAYSYMVLNKLMDTHNVGRNRGNIEKALAAVKAKTLIVGIDSDTKYPLEEQRYLAQYIPNSVFEVLESEFGHDAFLIETKKITEIILKHLHV